ncbi:hypothetical protein ACH4TS_20605 [Streptomyces albidoflavus]|uniref:hypothetical protein n=1 Tax=Streptomyces sp. B29(2018) TaxID=2485016 RepID=UPI000FD648CC|nr:hypothetical protein [Streptomyces sp. B29(2018)]
MTTTPLAFTPGQRIVWGTGQLPGTYNGPAQAAGSSSVTLDLTACSITVTVTTDSLGHAE